jgi:uncharacterized membrane protein
MENIRWGRLGQILIKGGWMTLIAWIIGILLSPLFIIIGLVSMLIGAIHGGSDGEEDI